MRELRLPLYLAGAARYDAAQYSIAVRAVVASGRSGLATFAALHVFLPLLVYLF